MILETVKGIMYEKDGEGNVSSLRSSLSLKET